MLGVRKAKSKGVEIEEFIIWVEAIPKNMFCMFTKSMRAFDYLQSNSAHTLFLKKYQGMITILIIYVDDMVVTGNDEKKEKLYRIIFLRNLKRRI